MTARLRMMINFLLQYSLLSPLTIFPPQWTQNLSAVIFLSNLQHWQFIYRNKIWEMSEISLGEIWSQWRWEIGMFDTEVGYLIETHDTQWHSVTQRQAAIWLKHRGNNLNTQIDESDLFHLTEEKYLQQSLARHHYNSVLWVRRSGGYWFSKIGFS